MAAEAQLFVVTLMMLVGALAAAYLPYWLRSSGTIRESQIALVSALGAGLLIGCSLGLIIPEGFHSLSGQEEERGHHHHEGGGAGGEAYAGLALIFGFLAMMFLEQYQHQDQDGAGASSSHHHHHHIHLHHHEKQHQPQPQQQSKGQHDIEISLSNNNFITSTSTPPITTASTSIKGTGTIHTSSSANAMTALLGGKNSPASVAETSAITGLLVHCAADGLALGAAVLAGNAALSLSVGTAMVLHKAPMSFGLATYLMNNNWSWERARLPLAAFSLAAPVSSWTTYLFLSAIPALTTPTSVALCLLISGGTFIHAACMHMIPEVMSSQGGKLCRNSMMMLVAGAVVPVILSWGHHH